MSKDSQAPTAAPQTAGGSYLVQADGSCLLQHRTKEQGEAEAQAPADPQANGGPGQGADEAAPVGVASALPEDVQAAPARKSKA